MTDSPSAIPAEAGKSIWVPAFAGRAGDFDRLLRVVLQIVVLALGLSLWALVVGSATFRPMCCRARS